MLPETWVPCGGIFAQADIECVFFARSLDKATAGLEAAVGQAHSDVLRKYIRAASYDDLEKEIPTCDWIFEGLAEDMAIRTNSSQKSKNSKNPIRSQYGIFRPVYQ